MKGEQVPYVPTRPSYFPDLPPAFDAPVETLEICVEVAIQAKLDTVSIRLDTGDGTLKYVAGVKGVGTIPATHHFKLPPELHRQLAAFAVKQIKTLYV